MPDRTSQVGSITGRVTTSRGAPLADAAVMITGDSPSHKDLAALTNQRGEYRFDGLMVGRYTLLVNAADHAPQTRQTQVDAGRVSHLDFSLANE